MRLEELKGQTIVLLLRYPLIEEEQSILATRLVEIEPSGIWIEAKGLAEFIQQKFKKPMPKTPTFFVPFAQIGWIMGSADYPYLSEKSLGL